MSLHPAYYHWLAAANCFSTSEGTDSFSLKDSALQVALIEHLHDWKVRNSVRLEIKFPFLNCFVLVFIVIYGDRRVWDWLWKSELWAIFCHSASINGNFYCFTNTSGCPVPDSGVGLIFYRAKFCLGISPSDGHWIEHNWHVFPYQIVDIWSGIRGLLWVIMKSFPKGEVIL